MLNLGILGAIGMMSQDLEESKTVKTCSERAVKEWTEEEITKLKRDIKKKKVQKKAQRRVKSK